MTGKYGKDNVLNICKKLKELKVIKAIEEKKYSIHVLIDWDGNNEDESYAIRDKIKSNFEKQGYVVHILGSYWLEIIFVDIMHSIDDCFMEE